MKNDDFSGIHGVQWELMMISWESIKSNMGFDGNEWDFMGIDGN